MTTRLISLFVLTTCALALGGCAGWYGAGDAGMHFNHATTAGKRL